MIKKIKQILIFVVMFLTIAMYHPVLYQSGYFDRLRMVVMVLLVCLVPLTFSFNKCKQIPFSRNYLKTIIFSAFVVLLLFAVSYHISWSDVIQLTIVFLFINIGIGADFNKNTFLLICTVYSISALVLGVLSINFYLGGFNLEESQFLIDGKNQIGVIVAVGGTISFFLSQHLKGRIRFLYIAIALFIFITLIVIRCRTALVAFVVFVFIYVMRFWSKVEKSFFLLALLCFVILYFDPISDIVSSVLLKNEEVEDINAISTGRFQRNWQGLTYFTNHFFTGELFEKSEIGLIHNYLLLRSVKYGIWVLPIVIAFMLFVVEIIKHLIKKTNTLMALGVYVLIIPFLCSLFEPNAPFGPGTVQMMSYLLFGIFLGESLKKEGTECVVKD